MRLNFIILIGIIVLTFLVTIFMHEKPIKTISVPISSINQELITKMPSFNFTAIDQGTFNSDQFKGKIILINFWASWCLPCIVEFPKLIELTQIYKDQLVLLAISSDEEMKNINKFINTLEKNITTDLENVYIVHDINKAITHDLFQTYKLPETIIVDEQGMMIHKIIGANWEVEDIVDLIKQSKEPKS